MRQTSSPLSTSSLRRFALGLALLASTAAIVHAEPQEKRTEAGRPCVGQIVGDFLHWLIDGVWTGGHGEDAAHWGGEINTESEIDTEIEIDPPNPPQR